MFNEYMEKQIKISYGFVIFLYSDVFEILPKLMCKFYPLKRYTHSETFSSLV